MSEYNVYTNIFEKVNILLFHYHFWTPYVEETEKFYIENGFRVSLRTGKYNGDFQTFNPPLMWDDFREKKIIFRIIEVRKGLVNITFGYGKKIMFDHIGFFVSGEDQNEICKNANELNWKVDRGERRTFITTPYNFRIELQSLNDAIDSITDNTKIEELTLNVKLRGLEKDLSFLFSNSVNNVISEVNNDVTIKKAVIKGFPTTNILDPNGVRVFNGM